MPKGKQPDLSTPEKRLKYWNAEAQKLLENRRISSAQYKSDKEFGFVFCITLESGVDIYVMADDEGAGPGSLHYVVPGKEGIQILPQMS
jgi:hypothetical protein